MVTALLAVTTGIGMLFGIRILATGLPGLPAMKPNAAVALLALAVAFTLRSGRRRSVRLFSIGLGGAVVVLALAPLYERWAHLDLHVGQWLALDRWAQAGSIPGQLPAVAAAGFILLGLAIATATRRLRGVSMTLATVAGAGAFFVIVHSLFAVFSLFKPSMVYAAIPTAIGQLALALGVLASGSTVSWLGTLLDRQSPAARVARRMLPLAASILGLFAWLIMIADHRGLYPAADGAALYCTFVTLLMTAGILSTAYLLRGGELEQQRREAELAETAARWRATFDHAGMGIVHTDPRTGQLLRVNPKLCEMLGYSREELTALSWMDISVETEWESGRQAMSALTRGDRERVELHKAYRRKDGTSFEAFIVSCPVRDAAGQILYLLTLIEDVSAARAADLALRKSEQKFRRVFDTAPLGMALWKWDGTVVEANQAYLTLLGYDHADLREGRVSWKAIHAPGQTPPLYELEDELRLVDICDPIERRYLRKDGTELQVLLSRSLLADDNYEGISIVMDMTSRMEAVRQLRERTEDLGRSNADLERFNRVAVGRELRMIQLKDEVNALSILLGRGAPYPGENDREPMDSPADPDPLAARQAALNMAEDAMTVANLLEEANRDLSIQMKERERLEDVQRKLATVVEQAAEAISITDRNGVILYVNPSFEVMTGYSSEEAVGQTPRILKSGKQDAAFYGQFWDTLNDGRVWHGTFVNRRKDGTFYREEATVSPVRDPTGAVVNYVAIKRDITQEVSLAEQLRHAQKLEAVGTLAGGVAHDFNNILQGIVAQVQVCSRELSAEERGRHLDLIRKGVFRGAQLTRQLLQFARREIRNDEVVDLGEVLTESFSLLRRVIPENIHVTLSTSARPVPVVADKGQLGQVIMNLVVNARDAMSGGGRLDLRCGATAGCGFIEVEDQGEGMTDEVRERIFEPFFTTKETGHGTGLGLAVVHGIVTEHGGRIEVQSELGGGTMFRVEFPLAGKVAMIASKAAPEEDLPRGRGERVLLVEDEPAVREGLGEILEMLGYQMITAATGKEAAVRVASESVAIVLTDFMLPDMNGLEVLREVRLRAGALPAILMSGYAPQAAVQAAVDAGELVFLQKPFDVADLARALALVTGARGGQVSGAGESLRAPSSGNVAVITGDGDLRSGSE